MGRSFLGAVLIWIWAASPAQAEPHLPPQSRLLASIVDRYVNADDALCFIATKVSKRFKYSRFDLPGDFRALLMRGQLVDRRVDDVECEKVRSQGSRCGRDCAVVQIFDVSELGNPTPWTPWPQCEQEKISFLRALEEPSGQRVLVLNIYRYDAWPRYISVYPMGPCRYLVFDAIVIE